MTSNQQRATEEVNRILADPRVHAFAKDAIREALKIDILDAYHDAKLIVQALGVFIDCHGPLSSRQRQSIIKAEGGQ